MSDEAPAPSDPATTGSTKDAVDRLLPKILVELEEMVENGGEKVIRHTCSACGNVQSVTFKVADYDLYVKALSALSAASGRLKADEDETSGAAVKLLKDRSELTDSQLAAYILALKEELGIDHR